MHTYFIMRNPGHNRVYFNQSQQLSLSELKIACRIFDSDCENIRVEMVSGVEYIAFDCAEQISENDLKIISQLSFVYAVFEAAKDGGKFLFSPIETRKEPYVDEKISSILKYSGKTNEMFTRMMINVALLSSDFHDKEPIELLDPVAGKGTTLFAGLVSGFNVSGIEISKSAVHDASVFFKKNLEFEKYKHSFSSNKLFGNDKVLSASIDKFEFARNKDEFKHAETRRKLSFVTGNSIYADKYFKKDFFHIIVGDLPYGVAHGNVTHKKGLSLTRNPSEFLTVCLRAWKSVLKKNGAIVLAFNSFVIPRTEMAALFEKNGFTALSESPYDAFEHRVDRSIKRDIIVGKKL